MIIKANLGSISVPAFSNTADVYNDIPFIPLSWEKASNVMDTPIGFKTEDFIMSEIEQDCDGEEFDDVTEFSIYKNLWLDYRIIFK